MRNLTVALAERSYPIFIGQQTPLAAELVQQLTDRQVMMVTNTTVAGLYLAHYQHVFQSVARTVASCILPDGEQYKDHLHVQLIYDALLEQGFNRDCVLVALGGGVVGDMTGFAAACYQRGVKFIQIPTTLLSQVDSSVGGKTGINHPLGKNMIGAFKQPEAVWIDLTVLDTLPARELSAGLAEVIKYALLGDADFLEWLEQHMPALVARDYQLLAEAVYRCCAHKARIVAADETEQGERALLNLGHTFGHAIESALGYGAWLHGEAVAVGMIMAADLSREMGWLQAADVERVQRIIAAAGLPVNCPPIALGDFLDYMSHDKKVLNGQLRLILLRQLGQAMITRDYDAEAMGRVIMRHQHVESAVGTI